MGFWRRQLLLFLLAILSPLRATSTGTNDHKVTMSVYYESLCPFCANFIVNHLVQKVYEKGLISILNLKMVPWGNAFLSSDETFLCQHGQDECELNTVEACAINAYPQTEKHLSFIYCVESLTLKGNHQDWASCFSTSKLEKASSINCYTTDYGKQLERQFANETSNLNPPLMYVPWVVVDNQPIREDYMNFVTHVCKAYKGRAVPEACATVSSATKVMDSESVDSVKSSVCYPSSVSMSHSSSSPTNKLT